MDHRLFPVREHNFLSDFSGSLLDAQERTRSSTGNELSTKPSAILARSFRSKTSWGTPDVPLMVSA